MNRMRILVPAAAIAIILIAGAVFALKPTPQHLKVRWLIVHEPVSLFDRAAQVFTSTFNAEADGTVEIEILGPKDVGATSTRLNRTEVLREIDSGNVQLATVVVGKYTSPTTSPEMIALLLPYMFENSTTAASVLDGPVGTGILDRVSSSMPQVLGLAFTFSGGPLHIESSKKLFLKPSDFQGARIGTINGAVAEATLRALGATPVRMNDTPPDAQLMADLDGIETTYTRLPLAEHNPTPRYMSETSHAFFLTTVIASQKFYESLSEHNKIAFRKAARAAAAAERADSLALGESKRAELLSRNTMIKAPSPDQTAALKKAAASVYAQFESVIPPHIIDDIRAAE